MQTTKLHFLWRNLCILLGFFTHIVSHGAFFLTIRQCVTIQKVRPNCSKCTIAIFWGTTLSIDSHPASYICLCRLSSASFPFVHAFPFFLFAVPRSVFSKSYHHSTNVSHLKFLLASFHNNHIYIFFLNVSPLLYPLNLNFHSPWPLMSASRQALLSVVK